MNLAHSELNKNNPKELSQALKTEQQKSMQVNIFSRVTETAKHLWAFGGGRALLMHSLSVGRRDG